MNRNPYSMTSETFQRLAAAHAQLAAERPRAYRLRLLLLGVLGYAVIAAIVLLLLSAWVILTMLLFDADRSVSFTRVLIWFVLVGITAALFLRMRPGPPEGVEVTADDEPDLFALIEEVRARLDGPRPHHVILTDQFNAGIMQLARFGPLGTRHYLMIGLPLLARFPVDELRAILAHEFAHLAAGHGRFGIRVNHMRMRWGIALEAVTAAGAIFAPFRRFFEWFVPYFEACAFVLSRNDEFAVDRAAATVASADTNATSLVRLALLNRYLASSFVRRIHRQALDRAEPPEGVQRLLIQEADQAYGHARAQLWLTQQLAGRTDVTDTHPSLPERLRAHGFPPPHDAAQWLVRLAPQGPSAADTLLRDLDTRLAALEAVWNRGIAPEWAERHHRLRGLRERHAALVSGSDSAVHRVALAAEIAPAEDVIHEARALVDALPSDPSSRFLLGRLLAELEDPAALEHLEYAMREDAMLATAGFDTGVQLLRRIGRDDEAAAFQRRWEERAGEGASLAWSTVAPAALAAAEPVVPQGFLVPARTPIAARPVTVQRGADRFLRRMVPATLDDAGITSDRDGLLAWRDVSRFAVRKGRLVLHGPRPFRQLRLRVADGSLDETADVAIRAVLRARRDDPSIPARFEFRRPFRALRFLVPFGFIVPGAFVHPGLYIAGMLFLVLYTWRFTRPSVFCVDPDAIRIHGRRFEPISLAAITAVGVVRDNDGDVDIALQNALGDIRLFSPPAPQLLEVYRAIVHRRETSTAAAAPAHASRSPALRFALAGIAFLAALYLPVKTGLAVSQAARFGSLPSVQLLLALGAPVNGRGYQQRSAVYEAAKYGHLGVLEDLARRGADLNLASDDPHFTPLQVAARRDRRDVVRFLLAAGVDPNIANAYGYTPLTEVAELNDAGDVELADLLIRHGAHIAVVDSSGESALYKAVEASNETLVDFLARHGADVNARTIEGHTPLYFATWENDSLMIATLANLGADLEARTLDTRRTALLVATNLENSAAMRALIAAGARTDAVDEDDRDPLLLAAVFDRAESARVLLDAGIHPDRQGPRPGAALHLAAWWGSASVARVLLERGADPHLVAAGVTPLAVARERGMKDVERVLLEFGAQR